MFVYSAADLRVPTSGHSIIRSWSLKKKKHHSIVIVQKTASIL